MSTLLAEPRTALLTFDEFITLPNVKDHELVEGVLTERKEMGVLSNLVAARLITRLGAFCEQSAAGHVLASEIVYRIFPDPNTGRKPDLSFISAARLSASQLTAGYLSIAPDLAVEIVSTHDIAEDVVAKIDQYLAAGIPEVWVLYPIARTLHIHRPAQPIAALHLNDTLQGSGPLAGFSCPLASLFPPPSAPAT